MPAYVPIPMRHPRADIAVTTGPRVIVPGMAVLPPLPRMLFWIGYVTEQVLVVNVRGFGLVLISGCGHPRIEQILAVTEQVLDVPIRAVVGGLHLPVHAAGTPLVPQAVLGNPHPPWQPMSERDAEHMLEQIDARASGWSAAVRVLLVVAIAGLCIALVVQVVSLGRWFTGRPRMAAACEQGIDLASAFNQMRIWSSVTGSSFRPLSAAGAAAGGCGPAVAWRLGPGAAGEQRGGQADRAARQGGPVPFSRWMRHHRRDLASRLVAVGSAVMTSPAWAAA